MDVVEGEKGAETANIAGAGGVPVEDRKSAAGSTHIDAVHVAGVLHRLPEY